MAKDNDFSVIRLREGSAGRKKQSRNDRNTIKSHLMPSSNIKLAAATLGERSSSKQGLITEEKKKKYYRFESGRKQSSLGNISTINRENIPIVLLSFLKLNFHLKCRDKPIPAPRQQLHGNSGAFVVTCNIGAMWGLVPMPVRQLE
jgi:hypothetical protein